MYVDLIAKQKELKANLDSVQIAVTGGAPCSPNLFRQMLDELKVKKVKVSIIYKSSSYTNHKIPSSY